MQRLQLTAADCEWLVSHAQVGDPLRLELIALAVRGGEPPRVLAAGAVALAALDMVLLQSGDVYRAKLSDGNLVSTLAMKIWAALLNERAAELSPLWREGFGADDARDDTGDQDGRAGDDADEGAERAPDV